MASRVTSVLVRVAMSTAVVLNKKEVDQEVMRKVWQCAMHTSRGITLDVVRCLYSKSEGITSTAIGVRTSKTRQWVSRYMMFLRRIEVVERDQRGRDTSKKNNTNRWLLTESLEELYDTVVDMLED